MRYAGILPTYSGRTTSVHTELPESRRRLRENLRSSGGFSALRDRAGHTGARFAVVRGLERSVHAGTADASACDMAPATCIATGVERRRPLAVDAMIPDPIFTSTHAITIDAPPEAVWPWIAQMGAGRAGWYSWDPIDNGGRPSATRVMPELQTVVPGDIMPAVPHADRCLRRRLGRSASRSRC